MILLCMDFNVWFYYSFIAFIEYMNAEKTFLDYTNLFFLSDCKNNDKIIYKYVKMDMTKRA